MTRLDTARDRLEQAVRRLEQLTSGPRNIMAMEDARLRETLDVLKGDYQSLHDVTQTVRQRLDATIERLEDILER